MSSVTSSSEKRTSNEPNSTIPTKSGKMKVFEDDFDNADRSSVSTELKSSHEILAMLQEEKKSEVTIDDEEGESGTLVAVLGDGFLVMGADSRAITLPGESNTLDRMKVFHIFGKVFALMAGDSRGGLAILKKVREQCAEVPPSSVMEVVNWSIKWANLFEHMKGTNCSFIVGGKLPNSRKFQLFVVEKREPEGFVAFGSDSPCLLGSDKDYARMYMEEHIHEILRSRDDPMRTAYQVRDALAYAVLNGKHSGGDLNVMTLEKDGTFVMYSSAREQKEEGGYKDLVVSDCRPLEWNIKEVQSNTPNVVTNCFHDLYDLCNIL